MSYQELYSFQYQLVCISDRYILNITHSDNELNDVFLNVYDGTNKKFGCNVLSSACFMIGNRVFDIDRRRNTLVEINVASNLFTEVFNFNEFCKKWNSEKNEVTIKLLHDINQTWIVSRIENKMIIMTKILPNEYKSYSINKLVNIESIFESYKFIYLRITTGKKYYIVKFNKLTSNHIKIYNGYHMNSNSKCCYLYSKNKLITIDKLDQIKTYTFPFEMKELECNDKNIWIHDYIIYDNIITYCYDLRLNCILKKCDVYVNSINNKHIVILGDNDSFIICKLHNFSYRNNKYNQNTLYKHILRLFI